MKRAIVLLLLMLFAVACVRPPDYVEDPPVYEVPPVSLIEDAWWAPGETNNLILGAIFNHYGDEICIKLNRNGTLDIKTEAHYWDDEAWWEIIDDNTIEVRLAGKITIHPYKDTFKLYFHAFSDEMVVEHGECFD